MILPDAGSAEAQALARALRAALALAAAPDLSIAVRQPAESGERVLQRARDALRPFGPPPPMPVPLRVAADGDQQRR